MIDGNAALAHHLLEIAPPYLQYQRTQIKMMSRPATIKGFEVMRMIRKRQCLMLESGTMGEVIMLASEY